MREISLNYGKSCLKYDLQDIKFTELLPKSGQNGLDERYIVNKALENFSQQLGNIREKRIAIGINDQTRPLPHSILLPALLDHLLNESNAKKENISFYFATGTHRGLTDEEIADVLPLDFDQEYTNICHNCDADEDLIFLGETTKGTPVYVNKGFYQAEVKIVVGNIEPHHFMGFSGGVKTAAIGLTGRKTIEMNHAMLPDPDAKMGLFMENPMRKDVEEIGNMIGVDYALNVVLNDKKEIIAAFGGNPFMVMQQGIPVSLQSCQLDIKQSECGFDLVIASAGGFPKDINLYQSQKALTNACLFSRTGGVIILAAACHDGAGNDKFLDYLQGKTSLEQIMHDFSSRPFIVGPHKAYQIAQQAKDHKLILISELDKNLIPDFMITLVDDINEALAIARPLLPENPRVVVLPYATHSMPKIGL